MNLIEQLNWRYATKQFDTTQKLSDDQLFQLTESLRLAPSSFGLQPWKFLIITNPSLREDLISHSWGQRQIADASHLIVLCAANDVTEEHVQHFIEQTAQIRSMPLDQLDSYKAMINGSLESRTAQERQTWAEKQVYIAQGFLLASAMQLGIDACPMEGFDRQAYDTMLGLEGSGYHSVVAIPVGFRSSEDKYAHLTKVRSTREEVITHI